MSRATSPPPACKSGRAWIAHRRGRHALGVFVGGTSQIFSAYLHAVEAWLLGGGRGGQERLEEALRHLVAAMQPSEWPLAAEAIPCLGDWGHVEELWERIRPAAAPRYIGDSDSGKIIEIGP